MAKKHGETGHEKAGDVEWHSRAWRCPECNKWNRPRHNYDLSGESRITRCRCGKKVRIKTDIVAVPAFETQIQAIEDID